MTVQAPSATLTHAMTAGLCRLGLVGPGERAQFEPLEGGVASDIFKVRLEDRVFVVKRALSKLRVAADWQAPVERNGFEYGWLETAGAILPGCVPKLLGLDRKAGLFAMEFLDPIAYPVWKNKLREGCADLTFAAQVGTALARLHARTAGDRDLARRFATDAIFQQIRVAPYLGASAANNPCVAEQLHALATRTLATRRALIHGDVSPKNILCGAAGPIFLDAECAWYGDPVFDVAFCLNHLLLKCLWNRPAALRYLACFAALAESYLRIVQAEPRDEIEGRIATLLPALMLARIDGKSPVEYLTTTGDRAAIRQAAIGLLTHPLTRLADIGRFFERHVLKAKGAVDEASGVSR
jgi:aminoglycoside phosphotransferase (APT) family kinase protein